MTQTIHPRIAADSLAIGNTRFSHIRLMNDSRWPWFLLLPLHATVTELHQLNEAERVGFLNDVSHMSEQLQAYTDCDSVNIAMLGNVVPDLHCHVVARFKSDCRWPEPVWGFGEAVPYSLTADCASQALRRVAESLLAQ